MKHIKLFEGFGYLSDKEKSLKDKISSDIDGILVELVDKGFRIAKFIRIVNYASYVYIKIDMKPTTGVGGYGKHFKYKEVKDYIHTIIDYLKYSIDRNIKICFEVTEVVKIFDKQHYISTNSEPNLEKEIHSILLKIDYDDEIH